jgi:hypothetical protein
VWSISDSSTKVSSPLFYCRSWASWIGIHDS